jgi:hypothetical protein
MFAAALARVKREANARHYQMFDLHAVKHWPVQGGADSRRGWPGAPGETQNHRVDAPRVARLEKEEEKRWGLAKAMAH